MRGAAKGSVLVMVTGRETRGGIAMLMPKSQRSCERVPRFVHRQGHHVEQDIRALVARHRCADHAAHLASTDRQRASLLEQPLRAHLRQLEGVAHIVVQRQALAKPNDHAGLVVVLQVGADAGCVHAHRHASASQHVLGADA